MIRVACVLLLLGAPALAAPVHGTVKLGDEPRNDPPSGYWRVENGVLPVQPATDAREAVVVLEPAVAPAKTAEPPTVTVELRGLRLDPRVLVVPVGATVQFKNADRVPHTLHADTVLATETTPGGQTRTQKFSALGEFKIRDEEYPHLSGMVLVVTTPYFATLEPSGAFKLDAPEGKYTARVWWRGAWVASQPVSVGHGEINIVVPRK
jgi:plastocyanin